MPAENNGLGWILTLTDTLMHEYGWLIDYTLWQVRLPVAFALYAAIAARYGNKPAGPTYLDREILDALQAAQA
ncbi:MAG TPA: hypothetical protein PLF88_13075 [Opitutaceae bacterium]|mgnify:CR=1 FL=1|nr:hypothetical protein [Opitutaceae bacterium]HRJ48146.1 hypothetical protein [Opitutaceae bacterium]